MPVTINGSTGISGVDGSAGTPAVIGSDADTGFVFAAGQVTASLNGTAANVPLVQRTAQNSTSGTSIDFTTIPSWVKRVTVNLNGVSLSGTALIRFRLADSAVVTSGYSGAGSVISSGAATANQTAGFDVYTNVPNASYTYSGSITFNNVSGNIWVAAGVFGTPSVAWTLTVAGVVTLSSALTQVRITTSNGTDTFDAGSINIFYE